MKGCGFELVWAIESVWVGCFGGAGMCTMVEASLNRCRLVISILEFPVMEQWVSGLFGWLFVSGSMVGWLYRILGFVGSVAV